MDWAKDSLGDNNRGPALKDLVQMFEFTDEFKEVRMIGPTRRIAWHYLPVYKADGTPVMNKWKQQTRIPKMCVAYDSKTGKLDPDKKCGYCEMKDAESSGYKVEAHTNVIDREIQQNAPEKKGKRSDTEKERRKLFGEKWFIKDSKKSSAFTPARYMVLKSSMGGKISDMTALNKKKIDGETQKFGPNHPKYGFDMNVKFDDTKKSPGDKYGCVKGDNTKLDEDEMKILLWDLFVLKPEDYETSKKEAKSFDKRIANAVGGSGGEDEDKSSSKKKSKGKADEEDWGDDEDLEDDDDSKKKKKKGKKSSKDDDDDWSDDDDSSSDDDDDDDEPKKKKKKKSSDDDDDEDDEPKKKKKKKKADDDDDDSSDDDEEDDEPKKKKKGKKKSSKDDDDDDDSSEDDDDDESKSKKKKKSKKSSDDDEEDDDDEPKSKKSSKKKKKSKDDDDDDSEDDDDGWDDD
jgi:hypothetical protein